MKCYFITRFSIYEANYRRFRLSRSRDPKDYERRLFDTERLDVKFDYFEHITVPSIVRQTSDEWQWHIYTSDRLPEAHLHRLRRLTNGHHNIAVMPVKDFQEFHQRVRHYDYGPSYATVRLDDDDGLAPDYVAKLQHYAAHVGSVISMSEGTLVTYTKDRGVILGKKVSEKNVALGLAGIGIIIYDCGVHRDIHTRFNVIYDTSPDMYLLACSPFTDTGRAFNAFARFVRGVRRRLEKRGRRFFSSTSRP